MSNGHATMPPRPTRSRSRPPASSITTASWRSSAATPAGFTVAQDCRAALSAADGADDAAVRGRRRAGGDAEAASPQPLRVRVVNGQAPVIGARVRFSVETGNGSLSVAQPVATIVPNGIATCGWTLGDVGSGPQQRARRAARRGRHPDPGPGLALQRRSQPRRPVVCGRRRPGGDAGRPSAAIAATALARAGDQQPGAGDRRRACSSR